MGRVIHKIRDFLDSCFGAVIYSDFYSWSINVYHYLPMKLCPSGLDCKAQQVAEAVIEDCDDLSRYKYHQAMKYVGIDPNGG